MLQEHEAKHIVQSLHVSGCNCNKDNREVFWTRINPIVVVAGCSSCKLVVQTFMI